MSRRTRVVALLAAAMVALPALAMGAPKQLRAKAKPTVSGPVSTTPDLWGCNMESRHNAGELVARFRICNGYYVFDPDDETDTNYDYGAYWVQGTVNTFNGWCTRELRTRIVGAGDFITARAPKPGKKLSPNRARKLTTKLTVDAQGAATTDGILKNSFLVLPGKLKANTLRAGKFRVEWTGKTDRKLGVVMGVELRWPEGDAPPEIEPSMSAVFQKTDC
jgi:hypothetical protein